MIHTWHTISVLNATFWTKRWKRWIINYNYDTLMFFFPIWGSLGLDQMSMNKRPSGDHGSQRTLCWISWWKGWWLEMFWIICGWRFSTPSRTGQILNVHCMPACKCESEFLNDLAGLKLLMFWLTRERMGIAPCYNVWQPPYHLTMIDKKWRLDFIHFYPIPSGKQT